MKLPKIKIDYSKAGSGEAPFDGAAVILHFPKNIKVISRWDKNNNCFVAHLVSIAISLDADSPTHYTPMPEFEEVE